MSRSRGWGERLRGNWFLASLLLVVASGSYFHAALDWLVQIGGLQATIVFAVMWMMAAPVPFSIVRNTLARPLPALLATGINLGLVPLLTLLTIPFLPPELAGGMLVAATVPSTLASAAVWTRKAGGDDTIAILVTLLTNLSCVVVTPLWLAALLGKQVALDVPGLMSTLVVLVVIPILLAQAFRSSKRFCTQIERHKGLTAALCQVGILAMVLMGSIQMGERMAAEPTAAIGSSWGGILAATLAACFIHTVALTIAWWTAQGLGIQRPQQIAVALSGSQKTLMIGLKLAIDCGVSILPMVAYHVSQLIIDTLLVKLWSQNHTKRSESSQRSR